MSKDGITVYQEINHSLDMETGAVTRQDSFQVKKVPTLSDTEAKYFRVYKYLNTLFAFQGIPQNLSKYIMEFGRFMGDPEEGQEITFNASTKRHMCKSLGVSEEMLSKAITASVKHGILKKIINPKTNKPYRGVYSVNPYIISQGSQSEVKKLQATFDFMSNEVLVGSEQYNAITSTTVKKAISNNKLDPNQLLLDGWNKE